MLEVQKYLLLKSLEDLKNEHGVESRIQDHKVSLNYSQILAKPGDPIVEECRGLILRKTNKSKIELNEIFGESKILCFGFKRFYNYGDPNAASIDWNSAYVEEKLDGSLCQLYCDDIKDEWHIATRSVPEANLETKDGWTFRSLFEHALTKCVQMNWEEFIDLIEYCYGPGYTLMFELCTPYNKIVVAHQESKIVCLGIRNLHTLKEELPLKLVFELPKVYDLNSFEDVVKFVNEQDPFKQEGCVVVDRNFNRVKIKNLSYVTYNKMRDSLSNSHKNCLVMVLEEKVDDLIGKLPKEIEDDLLTIQKQTREFFIKLEEIYKEAVDTVGMGNYKEFAMFVNKYEINAAPLFSKYRGKTSSFQEFFLTKKNKNRYDDSKLNIILESIK